MGISYTISGMSNIIVGIYYISLWKSSPYFWDLQHHCMGTSYVIVGISDIIMVISDIIVAMSHTIAWMSDVITGMSYIIVWMSPPHYGDIPYHWGLFYCSLIISI